ncbi:hypothetical protein HMPREF1531_00411 [Propionibacterium sp. oral taxon 192 str. F0372]|uniref:hypothetical protein n=1 Tax=Propionibacterium sp. oral taxon 192 TaxID=671222 RepID=UPI000352B502|nr:hypothetical protein [Propionibacterium sp. oral taxon 192]EPH06809.1 hypothetical protein HMPREF1531_00411 [Propionibacterium sp. oral taxon 192 str. F0372]
MTLYEDPHEVVKIDVEANWVTSVTVYPHWATHYDALALTKQLNSLLHEAANAPTPEQIPSEEEPPASQEPMTLERFTQFWAEFNAYQELLDKRFKKALAGELPPHPEADVEESDSQRHVGAAWVYGKFESMGFDPEWAQNTTAQRFSETLTDVLSRHPLIPKPVKDPEWDKIQAHKANMQAIQAGK